MLFLLRSYRILYITMSLNVTQNMAFYQDIELGAAILVHKKQVALEKHDIELVSFISRIDRAGGNDPKTQKQIRMVGNKEPITACVIHRVTI